MSELEDKVRNVLAASEQGNEDQLKIAILELIGYFAKIFVKVEKALDKFLEK